MTRLRATPIAVLGVFAGLIFIVMVIRSYTQDSYKALPFLLSDFVHGDTLSSPQERLALAERVYLPQDGSDVFISVLTASKYHEARLSRLFVSWMQTVEPIHVSRPGEGVVGGDHGRKDCLRR